MSLMLCLSHAGRSSPAFLHDNRTKLPGRPAPGPLGATPQGRAEQHAEQTEQSQSKLAWEQCTGAGAREQMIDTAADREAPCGARDARRQGAWGAGGLGGGVARLLALATSSA